MFICNIKLNKTLIFKILLILAIIIFLIIFGISTFKIFSLKDDTFKITDSIMQNEITELTESNYASILRMVHDNIDDYIGQKISFSGYIYKAEDFSDNQFVLARNMIFNNTTLIVGFLCNSDKLSSYNENDWVEITGEITKGDYFGETPIIQIIDIQKIEKPSTEYVSPPDDTYIQTSVII